MINQNGRRRPEEDRLWSLLEAAWAECGPEAAAPPAP
jgi:hypothetical protein